MKKLLFLIFFIPLLGCDKDNDTDSKSEKYFDSNNLEKLNLANIDNFWSEGINIDTSFYMGADFESNSEFIEGIRLYSGNLKSILISVFKTKKDAVSAMVLRINNVACIIKNGNLEEFEYLWWYSDCLDYKIFVNQHNTLVEIDFASNATFNLIKGSLLDIATETIERIDKLSDKVNN
jgi:hypothetical protein